MVSRTIGLLFVASLASGCSIMAPAYTPNYTAIEQLKHQGLNKMDVQEVTPKDLSAKVNHITLRGSPLVSPSGSFASYLEQAIKADLAEAKLLDPASTIKISANILKNDIDVSGFSNGYGELEATFVVKRESNVLYNKTLSANTNFESSFAGPVAIPRGQQEYPNLVRALLEKLYADKEFKGALK